MTKLTNMVFCVALLSLFAAVVSPSPKPASSPQERLSASEDGVVTLASVAPKDVAPWARTKHLVPM